MTLKRDLDHVQITMASHKARRLWVKLKGLQERAAVDREEYHRRWVKPDGGLRDMMARCALLAMHRDGLIVLPPPRHPRRAPGPVVFGPETEPPPSPPPATLEAVRPLSLVPSSTGPATTPCCGSSSSRATIISATSRWPALRCAIPWSTATAPRSP